MRILFGIAGWSYDDWRGRVYPQRTDRSFDPLAYLSGFVDLIEINSSFYRLPTEANIRSWLDRTDGDFPFVLKAPSALTHSRQASEKAARDFKAVAAIMQDAGRLHSVLLQFPWSFRANAANRTRIEDLANQLEGLRVAVEVRHSGFEHPAWVDFLKRLSCLPVNVDQPAMDKNLSLGSLSGEHGAYFRLHGRRADTWFADAGRDARYDYCYSGAELAEIADKIRASAQAGNGEVLVVANNHFRGQALTNILQLRASLLGEKVPVPPALLDTWPELASISSPSTRQQDLFGDQRPDL